MPMKVCVRGFLRITRLVGRTFSDLEVRAPQTVRVQEYEIVTLMSDMKALPVYQLNSQLTDHLGWSGRPPVSPHKPAGNLNQKNPVLC